MINDADNYRRVNYSDSTNIHSSKHNGRSHTAQKLIVGWYMRTERIVGKQESDGKGESISVHLCEEPWPKQRWHEREKVSDGET